MGLKYAARAARRGRARWAGRAKPAHGRGLRGLGRGACSGVIGGSRPLAPRASARQCRERSEATHGWRWAKPSDNGMTTRKPVTTRTNGQILPTDKHQAVFSLESEGFLLTRQKETSQNWAVGLEARYPSRRRAAARASTVFFVFALALAVGMEDGVGLHAAAPLVPEYGAQTALPLDELRQGAAFFRARALRAVHIFRQAEHHRAHLPLFALAGDALRQALGVVFLDGEGVADEGVRKVGKAKPVRRSP